MKPHCLALHRLLVLSLIIFWQTDTIAEEKQNSSLILSSPDFVHLGEIPVAFTCDGSNSSPTLTWSNVPRNAKSLVLIVDDPDAPDPENPKTTWVHWLLYNIPPTITELEHALPASNLPGWTQQGKNDWKRTGYGGPCPPKGRHRYFHKLYALDIELPNLQQPNKKQLESAMEHHIITMSELIGTYQRQ